MSNKVLFLLPNGAIGGTEKQTADLAEKIKFDSEIWFLSGGGDLINQLEKKNIKFKIFNCHKIFIFTPYEYLRFAIALRKKKPSIIHLQLISPMIIGTLFAKLFSPSSRIVVGIRGFLPDDNKIIKYIINLVLKKSDLIICNNDHLNASISTKYSSAYPKVKRIYNAVEKPDKHFNYEKNKLLVISNFHRYKNHAILPQILSLSSNNYSIELIGSGQELEIIKEEARRKSVDKRLVFLGSLDNPWDRKSIPGVALHPSFTEGFSNAILEELAHGLPVVASNIDANIKIIKHGSNGFLADPENPEEWNFYIEMMLNDSKLWTQMSSAAMDSVRAFTWESVSIKYDLEYKNLLNSNKIKENES